MLKCDKTTEISPTCKYVGIVISFLIALAVGIGGGYASFLYFGSSIFAGVFFGVIAAAVNYYVFERSVPTMLSSFATGEIITRTYALTNLFPLLTNSLITFTNRSLLTSYQ